MTIAPATIALMLPAVLIGSLDIGFAQTPTEMEDPPEPAPIESAPIEPAPVQSPSIDQVPDQAPDQAPVDSVPADYQVIMGDGWSFAVPPDWQNALTSSAELGDANIVAQLNDNQKQTVVNLVTQAYSGEGDEYIQRSLDTLTDLGFTVHAQQPITVSGLQGVELEVSLTASETTVRLWQRMVVDEDTSFALTCGGPEANQEAAQPICANILNSFQVIP